MQRGRFQSYNLSRLISGTQPEGVNLMTDRELSERVIATVAAYLHSDYCIGDRGGKVVRVEGEERISAGDARRLAGWLWSKHPALANGIETAIVATLRTLAAA